jgi:predicted DNA-binding transcriptional regulator AlpA
VLSAFFILADSPPNNAEGHMASTTDPYKVLTFKEWIALVGVSRSTGLRILDSGEGPPKIRLSDRRFGIRLSDHIKWCERLAQKAG